MRCCHCTGATRRCRRADSPPAGAGRRGGRGRHVLGERAKLQELLQTTRLPVAYALRDHVIAGGLLSYVADLPAAYRTAAKYVDKILKGAKPAQLPVEQATKFEAGDQPQDCEGTRPHDPAVVAPACG